MTASKKSFSEFLVDQGVVSVEKMTELLIQQTAQMPTVAEIALSSGLLTSAQVFAAFSHQMTAPEVCDFSGACQKLGFWTPAFEKGIVEAQARLRFPLVDLLIDRKLVESQKLVTMLDTYLSENAVAPVAVVAAVEVAVPVVEVVVAGSGGSDDHFEEFYTKDAHDSAMTLAHQWTHESADSANALIDKIHGLVGAARFAKSAAVEAALKEAENSVRGARDLPAIGDVLMSALRDDVVFNLEKAWKLRSELPAMQGAA